MRTDAWQASSTLDHAPAPTPASNARSESSAFFRLKYFDGMAVNVGLNLAPELGARSTAAKANGRDRHLHFAEDRERVAQAESDAFHDGPRNVSAAVIRGEPDQRGAGFGIKVRSALAHQVGSPEHSVASGRNGRRFVADSVVGSRPSSAKAPKLSRNQRSDSPADWVTPMMCQRPGIA